MGHRTLVIYSIVQKKDNSVLIVRAYIWKDYAISGSIGKMLMKFTQKFAYIVDTVPIYNLCSSISSIHSANKIEKHLKQKSDNWTNTYVKLIKL